MKADDFRLFLSGLRSQMVWEGSIRNVSRENNGKIEVPVAGLPVQLGSFPIACINISFRHPVEHIVPTEVDKIKVPRRIKGRFANKV